MKNHVLHIIIIAAMAMMMTSCGDSYKAEKLAKQFMKENMDKSLEINNRQFSELDSTGRITQAGVQKLRNEAQHISGYKKEINYSAQPTSKLLYLRVTYTVNDDTTKRHQTFYFDKELKGIVAFKDN